MTAWCAVYTRARAERTTIANHFRAVPGVLCYRTGRLYRRHDEESVFRPRRSSLSRRFFAVSESGILNYSFRIGAKAHLAGGG